MNENTHAAPVSQDDADRFQEFLAVATEFVRNANELAVMAIQLSKSEPMAVLLSRLSLLVQSTIIPSGLVVGTRGMAAFANVGESAASRMAHRQKVPSGKPGSERLYATDDIMRQMFYQPEPDVPTPEEIGAMSKSDLKRLIEDRNLEIDSSAKLPELRKAVIHALHGDA